MTTKIDLLRDILTDALINLDFNFDLTDDGDAKENEIEQVRSEVIEDMLDMIEDYDEDATNPDFTVRVVMDKPSKYTGLEVFPGIKESLDRLTIRTK
jgi:hypothetical protein